jgi:hypothetical protein
MASFITRSRLPGAANWTAAMAAAIALCLAAVVLNPVPAAAPTTRLEVLACELKDSESWVCGLDWLVEGLFALGLALEVAAAACSGSPC